MKGIAAKNFIRAIRVGVNVRTRSQEEMREKSPEDEVEGGEFSLQY